jgi:hypothetical protein
MRSYLLNDLIEMHMRRTNDDDELFIIIVIISVLMNDGDGCTVVRHLLKRMSECSSSYQLMNYVHFLV